MKVIKHIVGLMGHGVRVTYITGNHDELLRKFAGFKMGSLEIVNKLTLKLDDGDAWIFHGDVFDVTMQHSKWLARLGGVGYDMLILINRFFNKGLEYVGRPRISISKRIKNSVKSAVSFINNFEQLVADLASSNGYKYVVCGHIHQPEIKQLRGVKGTVTYLNPGDWVENLTALEYHKGQWSLYRHEDAGEIPDEIENEMEREMSSILLFNNLLTEFKIHAR
jgi:UDP-2,3-diacylglucosamine pyrophosphatase LpxH